MSEVVILFGGTSSERLVSVASAQHFATVLTNAACWFWSEDGRVSAVSRDELIAHADPFTAPFAPHKIEKQWGSVEAALDDAQRDNKILYFGLHGGDGENGWLQNLAEKRKLSFTGSGSAASALAMDKSRSKLAVKPRGVKVAEQYLFRVSDQGARASLEAFQKQFGSVVIKPSSDGSSAGLGFIDTQDQLTAWWSQNESGQQSWLAEEMIRGRELTIGVAMHRGTLVVLPPSEVILERNARFDYQGKYLGVGNREITPAELSATKTAAAQEISILAHTGLGCYGYTRSDMILSDRGIYYLETNTLPGFTKASFIPQQLRAANMDIADFLAGQLELARQRYD